MYYRNQSVLLASKHKKEQAIADVFFEKLSCTLDVHDFDTDQFGTFTGEIERVLNPHETCVLKARRGAEHYGYDLAIASEGSFGPHPALPFIASDHEIMVFLDLKHQWTISEQLTTAKTNYRMLTITPQTELGDFLQQIGFPEHAITVQTHTNKKLLAKGISDMASLERTLSLGFQHENKLFLATDMRAMMNPTRMKVIAELATKLAARVATLCARCASPGFGFKTSRGRLPCSLCGSSTSFYEEEIWGCIICEHQEYKKRSDGLLKADPTYCDYCNP